MQPLSDDISELEKERRSCIPLFFVHDCTSPITLPSFTKTK